MRIIHVLRKPLSEGTVTANTLKHGVGGLNIDASRISTDDNLNGGAYAENPTERWDGAENWRYKRGEQGNAGEYQQPSGRWPANVILQHLDGCVQGDTETVAAWACEPGCPVAALDAQTGSLKSGVMTGMQRGWGKHGIYGSSGDTLATCYADSGGASRFYKQVGGGKVPE